MFQPGALQSQLSELADSAFQFQNGRLTFDPVDPFTKIIQQIDMAVLGTTLEFLIEDKTLELQVSGRRLILVSASNDPALAHWIDKPLATEGSEDVLEISTAIKHFTSTASPSSRMFLKPGLPRPDLLGVSGRISGSMLRKALEQTSVDRDFDPNTWCDQLRNVSLAFLQFKEERLEAEFGSDEMVSALNEFRNDRLPEILQSEAHPKSEFQAEKLTILSETLDSGICVGLVRSKRSLVLIAFDVCSLIDLISVFDDVI